MAASSTDTASYSLQQLADEIGVKPRTVRSWIQQDLLPGPGARGRGAAYGEEHRLRLRLIRRMRDDAGIPLGTIRRLLLGRTQDELASLPDDGVAAAAALGHGAAATTTASQYLDDLLSRPIEPRRGDPPPSARPSQAALEAAFFQTTPHRKAQAERWWRIHITEDVELHVRAGSDPDARRRFERVADRVRQMLLHGAQESND